MAETDENGQAMLTVYEGVRTASPRWSAGEPNNVAGDHSGSPHKMG